eukprot:CAMPEP_0119545674 /NCGR_PEP_ID=MMETSP1352-20130426/359_1 /TAXON_ID=265584 /ORGANISM="Stauroneis constricta, Strain CCMP1120" /LENGTH=215 /DNA_ID=CAMNT_0007590253 /DNA_START=144 /DNA_END=790 /DNA_ORIENTATION=-
MTKSSSTAATTARRPDRRSAVNQVTDAKKHQSLIDQYNELVACQQEQQQQQQQQWQQPQRRRVSFSDDEGTATATAIPAPQHHNDVPMDELWYTDEEYHQIHQDIVKTKQYYHNIQNLQKNGYVSSEIYLKRMKTDNPCYSKRGLETVFNSSQQSAKRELRQRLTQLVWEIQQADCYTLESDYYTQMVASICSEMTWKSVDKAMRRGRKDHHDAQ